jgi:hypothetical protein
MILDGDPRRRLKAHLALGAGVGGCVTFVSAMWAFAPLPLQVLEAPTAVTVEAPVVGVVDPQGWKVVLVQPLADPPPPPPPIPPPPPQVSLVSIFRRNDAWVAAIDPGDQSGLHYVKVGDRLAGCDVTHIDQRGIDLSGGGQGFRVDLK